jgi:serine O-acetyltransferase
MNWKGRFRPSRRLFANLRDAYRTHGRSLRNGAFWALAVYHFGAWSLEQRLPPWRWLTSKTYGVLQQLTEVLAGVSLPRTTRIGRELHIIHGGGVSIHPNAVIGDRVGIMHNVTIGTNMGPGVPTIGDDVFIGCGASVLGQITVGNNARIAANSLVITDVPDGAVAIGVPAKILHSVRDLPSTARFAAVPHHFAALRVPAKDPLSLQAKLAQYVRNHIDPGFEPDEQRLLEVLDSVSFLGLIVFIEKEFGIVLEPSELRLPMFETVDTLVAQLRAA